MKFVVNSKEFDTMQEACAEWLNALEDTPLKYWQVVAECRLRNAIEGVFVASGSSSIAYSQLTEYVGASFDFSNSERRWTLENKLINSVSLDYSVVEQLGIKLSFDIGAYQIMSDDGLVYLLLIDEPFPRDSLIRYKVEDEVFGSYDTAYRFELNNIMKGFASCTVVDTFKVVVCSGDRDKADAFIESKLGTRLTLDDNLDIVKHYSVVPGGVSLHEFNELYPTGLRYRGIHSLSGLYIIDDVSKPRDRG